MKINKGQLVRVRRVSPNDMSMICLGDLFAYGTKGVYILSTFLPNGKFRLYSGYTDDVPRQITISKQDIINSTPPQ